MNPAPGFAVDPEPEVASLDPEFAPRGPGVVSRDPDVVSRDTEAASRDPGLAPRDPGRRRVAILGRLQDLLLTTAAIGGALVVAWLVISLVFGFSIVVFTTGSMAPSLPTGAAAITQRVPAADLGVGDVVTVPAAGRELPVTHRIVRIETVADDSTARSLVLRGDDNDTADVEPYRVTEVQRVVVGAAGIGYVVAALAQPASLAVISLLVAALVTWAFWPRRPPS